MNMGTSQAHTTGSSIQLCLSFVKCQCQTAVEKRLVFSQELYSISNTILNITKINVKPCKYNGIYK